jgi:hypothetical protein
MFHGRTPNRYQRYTSRRRLQSQMIVPIASLPRSRMSLRIVAPFRVLSRFRQARRRLAEPLFDGGQWQWKNSLTVPSGRTLKCSVTWFLNVDPSEPVPCAVKVKVPFTVLPFWLKPPQMVNLPV